MGADNCVMLFREAIVGPETPTVFLHDAWKNACIFESTSINSLRFQTGPFVPSSGTTRKTCGAEIYSMVMVAVGDVKN